MKKILKIMAIVAILSFATGFIPNSYSQNVNGMNKQSIGKGHYKGHHNNFKRKCPRKPGSKSVNPNCPRTIPLQKHIK